MKAAYILPAILWRVYFSFHSLLARQWVKERVYSFISARFYRLVYNSIALAGLEAFYITPYSSSASPGSLLWSWCVFWPLSLLVGVSSSFVFVSGSITGGSLPAWKTKKVWMLRKPEDCCNIPGTQCMQAPCWCCLVFGYTRRREPVLQSVW